MYNVIETKIIAEGEEVIVYGLSHEDGTVMTNVTANKKEAEYLAEYFNKENLASYQLEDVVHDMADSEKSFDRYEK